MFYSQSTNTGYCKIPRWPNIPYTYTPIFHKYIHIYIHIGTRLRAGLASSFPRSSKRLFFSPPLFTNPQNLTRTLSRETEGKGSKSVHLTPFTAEGKVFLT
jgi:hypothetical protein